MEYLFELLGSLTGNERFACQDSSVSQIFSLLISNGGNILSNVKVVLNKQVKMENKQLTSGCRRLSKTRALKLPNITGKFFCRSHYFSFFFRFCYSVIGLPAALNKLKINTQL